MWGEGEAGECVIARPDPNFASSAEVRYSGDHQYHADYHKPIHFIAAHLANHSAARGSVLAKTWRSILVFRIEPAPENCRIKIRLLAAI